MDGARLSDGWQAHSSRCLTTEITSFRRLSRRPRRDRSRCDGAPSRPRPHISARRRAGLIKYCLERRHPPFRAHGPDGKSPFRVIFLGERDDKRAQTSDVSDRHRVDSEQTERIATCRQETRSLCPTNAPAIETLFLIFVYTSVRERCVRLLES